MREYNWASLLRAAIPTEQLVNETTVMPSPLIECVPNFSEARRPEVIESIQEAILSIPAVRILDRHSDLDHNRTVLTFVGPPKAVEQAAFRAIERAAELINLDQHTGEHPRIGATDVVPFVPIRDVSMAECVEIARRLGQRVGQELGIPVYLYEEAATHPDRQNLENLRRGQYEGLKSEIETKPERAPDFGPAHLGPAGATVIGARAFLIAYNVYLTTDEVAIAEKIARAIRHSSGGLRYVKALGLLVDGRAQVSMNLTDFRKTPVMRVQELIQREAARHGTRIHHSELVGLIPEDALVDAAIWYLQLDQFNPEQILEKRLAVLQNIETSDNAKNNASFLDALAAGTAAPGGGSAAAYAGSMAAALVAMVARLTIGKKKYAPVESQMKTILERAEDLRQKLTAAVQEDASAYQAVMETFQLPRNTLDEVNAFQAALESATINAAEVPLEVARMAVEVLDLALQVIESGNLNAISDGGSAAALAGAALKGAGLNVRINIASLKDKSVANELIGQIKHLDDHALALQEKIQNKIIGRGGLSSE